MLCVRHHTLLLLILLLLLLQLDPTTGISMSGTRLRPGRIPVLLGLALVDMTLDGVVDRLKSLLRIFTILGAPPSPACG